MQDKIRTISPVDGVVYVERDFADKGQIDHILNQATKSQKKWRNVSLEEKKNILEKAVQLILLRKEELGAQLTCQMGRPISQTGGEIEGFADRARHMMSIAEVALKPITVQKDGEFHKYISKDPVGVIFIMAPWNYPYLTVVNSLIPALLSGNSVVLKHSPQTPLVAEMLVEIFKEAGVEEGVFSYLHLSDDDALNLVKDDRVKGVIFTGSVLNGKKVEQVAAGRFIPLALELGGKDPAYVRADMNIEVAAENLVDGAFYNSGQSCCGVERIYVHESCYSEFVKSYVKYVKAYKFGNPTLAETNLGPLVGEHAVKRVQKQIDDAVKAGAETLIPAEHFEDAGLGKAYLAPQVLINVDHSMSVMNEETFGPVVGIMSVADDEEAIRLMNDSRYGLTASIWTENADAAMEIGQRLETGTVFLNRCDYLDPALAWTGVKETGRGCSLSILGFDQVTRPKSYHFRLK